MIEVSTGSAMLRGVMRALFCRIVIAEGVWVSWRLSFVHHG